MGQWFAHDLTSLMDLKTVDFSVCSEFYFLEQNGDFQAFHLPNLGLTFSVFSPFGVSSPSIYKPLSSFYTSSGLVYSLLIAIQSKDSH